MKVFNAPIFGQLVLNSHVERGMSISERAMNGSNDCRRRTTRNPRSNATVPNAVGLRVPREVNFAFESLERGSPQLDGGLSSVKVDPPLKKPARRSAVEGRDGSRHCRHRPTLCVIATEGG